MCSLSSSDKVVPIPPPSSHGSTRTTAGSFASHRRRRCSTRRESGEPQRPPRDALSSGAVPLATRPRHTGRGSYARFMTNMAHRAPVKVQHHFARVVSLRGVGKEMKEVEGFNAKVAVLLTRGVGTMACAYLF